MFPQSLLRDNTRAHLRLHLFGLDDIKLNVNYQYIYQTRFDKHYNHLKQKQYLSQLTL